MRAADAPGTDLGRLQPLIEREAASLVARVREWTPARWASGTSSGLSRGAVGHHLAAQLALAAQGIEEGAAAVPPRWRSLPRLGTDLVVPDQIAVTAADLLAALVARGAADAWSVNGPQATGLEIAAGCLAELQLHRHDLDGSPPLRDAAAAVLRVLDPDGPLTPAALLVAASARCPLNKVGASTACPAPL